MIDLKEDPPEIKRLKSEIECLINSGMYTDEDPIIQELQKQIKILLS